MVYRRPMGIETEYGVTLFTAGGRMVQPGNLSWFLRPLKKLIRHGIEGSSQKLYLCPEDKFMSFVWVGATGGLIYRDCMSRGEILEYATPECGSVDSTVLADKGGELVLYMVTRAIFESEFGDRRYKSVMISKNNSDLFHGLPLNNTKFRGSHENYQINRKNLDNQKEAIVSQLPSLLASRILFSGGGGLLYTNGQWKYVISPRALITSEIVSDDLIGSGRPMISFRYGEMCTNDFVRLHIPVGDSNMMPRALKMRLFLVDMFLRMYECGEVFNEKIPLFESSIAAMHLFSQDPTSKTQVRLGGSDFNFSMADILGRWIEIFLEFVEKKKIRASWEEKKFLRFMHSLIEGAKHDIEVLYDYTDWGLKLRLLREYCTRLGIEFSHPKARAFDVYYGDISPRGIYNRWARDTSNDPFSKKLFDMSVWNHKTLPRASLRKKYIQARAQRDLFAGGCGWGSFFIDDANEDLILADDPVLSDVTKPSLRKITHYIGRLKEGLSTPPTD